MTITATASGRRAALALIAVGLTLTGVAFAQSARTPLQEAFIGVYRLAAYAPHGERPIGRISYDTSGRMWAMITPPGRPSITPESPDGDFRTAMNGLVAYWGTYTIDASSGRVIHHVEAASNPAWIGDDFVRWYRFEGNRLTLSLNPDFNNPIVWERLAD